MNNNIKDENEELNEALAAITDDYYANYDKMQAEIEQEASLAVQNVSENIKTATLNASEQLCNSMDDLKKAEKAYGPSPESWEKYKDEHHEPVKQNLQEIGVVATKPDVQESEIKATADKAVKVMGEAKECLDNEKALLIERDNKIQQELAIIYESLDRIKKYTAVTGYSSEELQSCMRLGNQMLEQSSNYHQLAWKNPGENFIKQFSGQVTDACQQIKAVPEKIKEAIKHKAFSMVDSILRKTADTFKSIGQYCLKQSGRCLKKSPLYKKQSKQEKRKAKKERSKGVAR